MGQPGTFGNFAGEADHALDVLRHEFANVLNGLCGATGMLRATRLNPDQERWLDAIESSVTQMAFLIRTSHRAGAGPPCDEAADQGLSNGIRLLERLVTAHLPLARERRVRILLSIDPDLPARWRCPAGPIRQVLDNLLGNALKFAPGGDVIVAAEPMPGACLRLSVTDNGPGLDGTDIERVFGAYQRGAQSSGTPGSGLGLHLCRRIASQLGGDIQCRSRPGRGACFAVDLPGVLMPGLPRRERSGPLEGVQCVLDLDGRLADVTGKLLDRLGVNWSLATHAQHPVDGGRLEVRVDTAPCPAGSVEAPLVLRPRGGDPAVVSGAVLPSVLESALLRLVLEWRWRKDQSTW